jgi:ATP-dependent exoDNAse (exonuclease V) alpha subunit
MAIFHFSAKVIGRSSGRSAVAAAAYRAGEKLFDERIDRDHDFTGEAGVEHSEVLLPEGAPEHLADREKLWNAVEAAEKRKDAQLAREVEFALPRELAKKDAIELARDFVEAEFVAEGMIADLNVHWDIGADGHAPHARLRLRGLSTPDQPLLPLAAAPLIQAATLLVTRKAAAAVNAPSTLPHAISISVRLLVQLRKLAWLVRS